MRLPESWVEALFERLIVRYGAAFMRQYEQCEPALVKADWAQVLGGFQSRPDAIRYAIDNLPNERPPNALQFRALCNSVPEPPPPPQIEGPKPQPSRVAALLDRMRAATEAQRAGPDMVASRLREIAKTRRLTQAQMLALAECERVETPSGDMGQFRPIDPAVLPPGMRA
jgi:Arc/MetJ-type ribon-helix-helix transcriptional regulator